MQSSIIPIDILESYESDNVGVSAVPTTDVVYVFCPNYDSTNEISSYSAYPMTVGNLIQLYNEFSNWKDIEQLSTKLEQLSSYYWNTIKPTMLSDFVWPNEIKHEYMCRVQRTSNNFPYDIDWSKRDISKRTKLDPSGDFTDAEAERGSALMYHGWADFQTKTSDIGTLARLAPGATEMLNNPNSTASDKFLEYRRQFVISLLQNRKRMIMTNKDTYSAAVKNSRLIRFGKFADAHVTSPPDLYLGDETLKGF